MNLSCVLVLQKGILRQLLIKYLESSGVKVKCAVDCNLESVSAIISHKPSLVIIGTPIEANIINSIAHTLDRINPIAKVLMLAYEPNALLTWPNECKHQLLDLVFFQGECELIINSISVPPPFIPPNPIPNVQTMPSIIENMHRFDS